MTRNKVHLACASFVYLAIKLQVMAKTKEYSNGEVTVVWDAKKCIHSGICVKGLPSVFRPKVRPWVRINEANTEAIVNQVKLCPSNALSYYMNSVVEPCENNSMTKVEVLRNGPILVHGAIEVNHADGNKENKTKVSAFCRCGQSNNKPYCDGAHVKNEFAG